MQVNFILNLLTCFKSNYFHVVNLSLTCFFICSLSVNASEQITIKEQQLKSAFIYNFSRLVNWPEESLAMNNSLFNICLIGEDNFNNALSPLQNRTANNYKISIKRHINLAEISQCQILYISQDRKDQLFQLFQLSKKFHILTISDINNFGTWRAYKFYC